MACYSLKEKPISALSGDWWDPQTWHQRNLSSHPSYTLIILWCYAYYSDCICCNLFTDLLHNVTVYSAFIRIKWNDICKVYCVWHRLNTKKQVYVSPVVGIVLVLYCITNYYKLSSWKYPFLSASFCRSEIHDMPGFSAQNLRLNSRCPLGCAHFWRLWERISFRAHSGCWQNSVACRTCKTKVPFYYCLSWLIS